ncbi:MAG: hypothetical protein R2827_05405 [Bdellovibrionales bacterium]
MKKFIRTLVMGLMAFGITESALAQGCPTDYPQEYCDYWGVGNDPTSHYFIRWYLDKPAEVDTSFIASNIFFSEERDEPVPFGETSFNNGLPYTQSEFNQWADDTALQIAQASSSQELQDLYTMLEFAATEVDTLFHFAKVLDLAIDANHPAASSITSDVIAAKNFYMNGGSLSPAYGVEQQIEYREFVCSLGSDACPHLVTNLSTFYSNNIYGITYGTVEVFYDGVNGATYTGAQLDDFLLSATEMLINGMNSSVRSQVEGALVYAGVEVDTVSHFALVLSAGLDFGLITLPSGLTSQQQATVRGALAFGSIHSLIIDWATDLGEANGVDVYDANLDILRDVP